MDLQHDCQVKIQAGIAKKVGRPNYSSYDAALSITMITNIEAVTDDRFGELVANMYDRIQNAVDARIAWECRNDSKPAPVSQPIPSSDIVSAINSTGPAVPAAAPVEPQFVFGRFSDLVGYYAQELGVDPKTIVNACYGATINGPIPREQWQEQGKAVQASWEQMGNEAASRRFSPIAHEVVPF